MNDTDEGGVRGRPPGINLGVTELLEASKEGEAELLGWREAHVTEMKIPGIKGRPKLVGGGRCLGLDLVGGREAQVRGMVELVEQKGAYVRETESMA